MVGGGNLHERNTSWQRGRILFYTRPIPWPGLIFQPLPVCAKNLQTGWSQLALFHSRGYICGGYKTKYNTGGYGKV